MPDLKGILTKEFTDTKSFNYKKNECSLNFNLRTDIKGNLKDFLELLKVAVVDVEKELAKK